MSPIYGKLQKYTPRHNDLIVMGDLNAKIGQLDAKFTYNRVTNRNVKLLLDYLEECDLRAIQAAKKEREIVDLPKGAKSQLDYQQEMAE